MLYQYVSQRYTLVLLVLRSVRFYEMTVCGWILLHELLHELKRNAASMSDTNVADYFVLFRELQAVKKDWHTRILAYMETRRTTY